MYEKFLLSNIGNDTIEGLLFAMLAKRNIATMFNHIIQAPRTLSHIFKFGSCLSYHSFLTDHVQRHKPLTILFLVIAGLIYNSRSH